MTHDDGIERVLEQWMTDGPTRMPGRFLVEMNERIDDLPRRPLAGLLARLGGFGAPLRLAAAAAVLVVAAGVGSIVLTRLPGVGVGASPSPVFQPGALPADLQATWRSVGPRGTPFRNRSGTSAGTVDRVDIAIGEAEVSWDGFDIISSASLVGANSLELTLVSAGPRDAGAPDWNCQTGDAGTYMFTLSSGGQQLTLTPVSDACPERSGVLAGDWVRTGIGELAPGRHVSPLFRPFGSGASGQLSFTVPAGWAAIDECATCLVLAKPGAADDASITLSSWVVPFDQDQACATSTAGVAGTPDAIAGWLRSQLGIVATNPTPASVGGLSGNMLDLALAPGWTCPGAPLVGDPPAPETRIWTFSDHASPLSFSLVGERRARYILLDRGDGRVLLLDIEAQDTPTFDAFVNDAMPIIESLEFTR